MPVHTSGLPELRKVLAFTEDNRRSFVGEIAERFEADGSRGPQTPMANVNIRLPQDVLDLLDQAAQTAGVSRSTLLRIAIADWIEQTVAQHGGSVEQIELPLGDAPAGRASGQKEAAPC